MTDEPLSIRKKRQAKIISSLRHNTDTVWHLWHVLLLYCGFFVEYTDKLF